MELFFNELSAIPIAETSSAARSRMAEFARTLGNAIKAGCRPVLRTPVDFLRSPLAPDYHFYQWRNDLSAERDHRVLVNSVSIKSPHLEGLGQTRTDEFLGCEGTCEGVGAVGLTAALLCGSLGVSLLSDAKWDMPMVKIDISALQTDAEIVSNTKEVRHASRSEHVATHRRWIEAVILNSVEDGSILWESRGSTFSHLDFSEDIREMIISIGGKHVCFTALLRRLQELNDLSKGWVNGPFPYSEIGGDARPESATTLEQFANSRTFPCLDGVSRVFSWHVSLPQGWRLYFLPDPSTRRVHVGYVGGHLPTVKFPN